MFDIKYKWKDMGYAAFTQAMIDLNKQNLVVGFQGQHSRTGKEYGDVALFAEFGTSQQPARPFIRPTFSKNAKKYGDMYLDTISKGLLNGDSNSRAALDRVGGQMTQDIRNRIVRLKSPGNAASTVKRKKGRNPLIDSGGLLDSITFVVGK